MLHWLAYLSWPVAVAHSLGMGTDAKLDWVLGLVALCVASVVAVTTWRRRRECPRQKPPPANLQQPAEVFAITFGHRGHDQGAIQ